MHRCFWALLLVVFVSGLPAQSLSLYPYTRYSLNISADEFTLFHTQGDRIRAVKGRPGTYQVKTDKNTGIVLLKPLTKKPFQLFITTEKGFYYVFSFHPLMMPGEPLVISAAQTKPGAAPVSWERQQAIALKSKPFIQLMESMYRGDKQYRVASRSSMSESRLPHITQKTLATYHWGTLTGVVYQLINQDTKSHVMTAEKFSTPKTQALLFTQDTIPPHQSIQVYEVQE